MAWCSVRDSTRSTRGDSHLLLHAQSKLGSDVNLEVGHGLVSNRSYACAEASTALRVGRRKSGPGGSITGGVSSPFDPPGRQRGKLCDGDIWRSGQGSRGRRNTVEICGEAELTEDQIRPLLLNLRGKRPRRKLDAAHGADPGMALPYDRVDRSPGSAPSEGGLLYRNQRPSGY
jgi:hypothetical protein